MQCKKCGGYIPNTIYHHGGHCSEIFRPGRNTVMQKNTAPDWMRAGQPDLFDKVVEELESAEKGEREPLRFCSYHRPGPDKVPWSPRDRPGDHSGKGHSYAPFIAEPLAWALLCAEPHRTHILEDHDAEYCKALKEWIRAGQWAYEKLRDAGDLG